MSAIHKLKYVSVERPVMDSPTLQVEVDGDVAIVRHNRPSLAFKISKSDLATVAALLTMDEKLIQVANSLKNKYAGRLDEVAELLTSAGE